MKKYKSLALNVFVFLFLFVFLMIYSKFHFFCVEQNQLFQQSWPFISEKLVQPGGFALVVAEYLVQFFIIPNAGALITALLLVLVGMLTNAIMKRIDPDNRWFLFACLPILTLLFIHLDYNYIIQGTVAFIMMLSALYAVLGIRNINYRLTASIILTVLLFVLAGPVFSLFAVSVILCEAVNRTPKWYYSLVMGLVALLLGICSVYYSFIGEYRFAFLPDGYYHIRLQPDNVIYYSWLSLLLAILAAFVFRGRKVLSRKMLVLADIAQLLILVGLFWKGIELYGDAKSYRLKIMDYYARTEQWDKILDMCKKPMTNYLYICHANMALAQKGLLADNAFKYDQRGLQGLAVTWNKSANVSTLLSDIYFTMGNVAIAQEMAFESNIASLCDGNPRMVKRLIQTNLIYGAYPIAEKYISILENTAFYKDWAKEQRKFLYNDVAVESDPLLGGMRKGLLANNTLSQIDGFAMELKQMVDQNPSNKTAFQYLGVFYLLGKDMDGFKQFIETYYGTELLPSLPVPYQEAIITLSEREPDYWKRFGVSESIVQRFADYKQQVLANRNNVNSLPGLMSRSYGDTYWYYFMFK